MKKIRCIGSKVEPASYHEIATYISDIEVVPVKTLCLNEE